MVLETALRHAWADTLDVLGAGNAESILLVGAGAETLAREIAPPVGDALGWFVVLGDEPVMIPADARPEATGLASASFDAVVALEAWRAEASLKAVVVEAVRLTKPGGTVWLGQRDFDLLARSEPATYRAALLYRARPDAVAAARSGLGDRAMLGIEAIRAGLRPVESLAADLPTAQYDTEAEYFEAVRSGGWAGIGVLDDAAVDALLGELARFLRPPRRFPVVERQPWSLVRATKPS